MFLNKPQRLDLYSPPEINKVSKLRIFGQKFKHEIENKARFKKKPKLQTRFGLYLNVSIKVHINGFGSNVGLIVLDCNI